MKTPKTLAELLKAVAAIGANLEDIRLTERPATHDAPLGKKPVFHSDAPSYPVFVGVITGPSSLMENYGSDYPWTKLGWLHSGTGGVGGVTFQYDFRIWADDVPQVAAEWREKMQAVEAVRAERAALYDRRRASQVAASEVALRSFDKANAKEIAYIDKAAKVADERWIKYLNAGKKGVKRGR